MGSGRLTHAFAAVELKALAELVIAPCALLDSTRTHLPMAAVRSALQIPTRIRSDTGIASAAPLATLHPLAARQLTAASAWLVSIDQRAVLACGVPVGLTAIRRIFTSVRGMPRVGIGVPVRTTASAWEDFNQMGTATVCLAGSARGRGTGATTNALPVLKG